jgi:hypothetical protein
VKTSMMVSVRGRLYKQEPFTLKIKQKHAVNHLECYSLELLDGY